MMDKGTLVFYFFHLHQSSGGAERMIIRLSNEMARRGWDVHLVSWDDDDAQSFYPIDDEVTWHRLGVMTGLLGKFRRVSSLRSVLMNVQADCLIGFVMSADKSVYGAAWSAGVPIIAAERNAPRMYWLKDSWFKRFIIFNMLRCVQMITVQMKEYTLGYPSSLRAKIKVIENPVVGDKRVAKVSEANDGGRYEVVCVCRFEPQKQVMHLVEAFSGLEDLYSDWDLRLVGDGAEMVAIQKHVSEMGLHERIRFTGPVDDVESELASAHIFCLPSAWEGFPNALAEAMAQGLPSIGYESCDGVNGLIDHNQNGLLVADLSEGLSLLMGDSGLRAKMGQNAVSTMKQFEPSPIFDKWEVVFRQVCQGKRDE